MLTVGSSSRALDANDSAPEPDPARAAEIAAQSGQLPVTVLGLIGDGATKVRAGDIPREDQDAILVLDHHTHSGPEPDTFKS